MTKTEFTPTISPSAEQARSVSQVSEKVTQMDQTTPQYAALVEQMAAAAGSLKSQALDLVQNGDVFKNSQSRPTTGFQSVGGGSAGHESSYHISPRKPKANDAAPPRLGNAAKSIGLNK